MNRLKVFFNFQMEQMHLLATHIGVTNRLVQRRILPLMFIFHQLLLPAQSFVKKDSSDIIPFVSKLYFSHQMDSMVKLDEKINTQHRLSQPILSNNYYTLLGTLGSPLPPTLYENKFYTYLKLGRTINDPYFYSEANIPYFALNKPLSELDFIFFGNGNEVFRGFLSQNISQKLNIGIGIKRSNNKGFFLQQATEHSNLYAYAVYQTKRWRSNLEFVFNEMNLKESGGYTPDIYRSTLTPSQWGNATPLLSKSKNQLKNFQLNFRNRWLITSDTTYKDSLLFRPIRSLFYLDNNFQIFSERQYYSDTLLSTSRQFYGILDNAVDSSFKSKYLNTGYTNEFKLHFNTGQLQLMAFNVLSLNNLSVSPRFDTNIHYTNYLNIGLGGELLYKLPYGLQLSGKAYKALLGYTQNDFLLRGKLEGQFKDWNTGFWTQYSHQLPSFLTHYTLASNFDSLYNLNTQKTLELGATIQSKKIGLDATFQYFIINDYTTLDTFNTVIQLQNNFAQLHIKKDWRWKWLYFPTQILYQNSLYRRGILKQTLAYQNKFFSQRNTILFGADMSLNFDYAEAPYSTFYMAEQYYQGMSKSLLYPKIDFFATFKIYRVHLSLVIDNFMSTYLKKGTSYMKNHPLTPAAFFLRMNWTFLE